MGASFTQREAPSRNYKPLPTVTATLQAEGDGST